MEAIHAVLLPLRWYLGANTFRWKQSVIFYPCIKAKVQVADW